MDKEKDILRGYLDDMTKLKKLSSLVGFEELVSWAAMNAIKISEGEVLRVKGIENTCLLKTDYHIVFRTIIKKGQRYDPYHYHDFIEICVVHQGVLSDDITGLDYTDRVEYDMMQKHLPFNQYDEDVILTVHWVNTIDMKGAREAVEVYHYENEEYPC